MSVFGFECTSLMSTVVCMTSHANRRKMAVNFESGVSLQTPNKLSEIHDLNEDATTITSSFHCKLRYRARRVQSKGAVLDLSYMVLFFKCGHIVPVCGGYTI